MLQKLDFNFPGITRVPVELSLGSYPFKQPDRTRDWVGHLKSVVPFVSISLFETSNQITWCQSNNRAELESEVCVYVRESKDPKKALLIYSSGRHSGLNRYVTFPSPNYLPKIHSGTFETGQVIQIASCESVPKVTLSVLTLTRSDVKSGRNGIWHIREEFVPLLKPPWSEILVRGRNGSFSSG